MDIGLIVLYIVVVVAISMAFVEIKILFASYRSLDKRLRDFMSATSCNDISLTQLNRKHVQAVKAAEDLKLLMEYFELEVVDGKKTIVRKQKN